MKMNKGGDELMSNDYTPGSDETTGGAAGGATETAGGVATATSGAETEAAGGVATAAGGVETAADGVKTASGGTETISGGIAAETAQKDDDSWGVDTTGSVRERVSVPKRVVVVEGGSFATFDGKNEGHHSFAETYVGSQDNPFVSFFKGLRMYLPETEPKVKEAHYTRAELRERYKKRLEHLNPEERRKLRSQRIIGAIWPIFRTLIIAGLCFIILYPLIFMVTYAFREQADMSDPTVLWIPRNLTIQNILDAAEVMEYWSTFRNTLVVNIVCSVIQVLTCALTGYGFARFKFKGKSILFFIVILQILMPTQILAIPQFKFFRYFNLFGLPELITGAPINFIDNPFAMYFPAIMGHGIRAGLFIFLFRQAFRGLPKELEDAAYLDGCSPLRTFVTVMTPNASTTFITVFLFSIVWYWNDFYVTSTFFTSFGIMALKLQNLSGSVGRIILGSSSVIPARDLLVWLEAGCLISIIPILILYIALQKYFTEGIARSGLTGM
jgi:multiple sugar transport system permease protein